MPPPFRDRSPPVRPVATVPPLTDEQIDELDHLIDRAPAPLEPLDISALDGYLCGVLLQARRVPESAWWPWLADVDGQPWPDNAASRRFRELVRQRHAFLDEAIERRDWFDPWVFGAELSDEEALDEDEVPSPHQQTLPWVIGFAAAMEHFPDLMDRPAPALLEPLAVLFAAFDPSDLEDAQDILTLIEELEPPSDLTEATEDLVRSVLLMADVTRPLSTRPSGPPRRSGSGRGPQGRPGPGSNHGNRRPR
jgi:uncharacterized protein